MSYNFETIREVLSTLESPKRFKHTLGVEDEAYELGLIFLPQKANKLKLCGLLHDITKDFTLEKQLELCEKYNIGVDKENLVPKLLHSKTGAEYSRELFGTDIVDDEIYSGIYYHTTGKENMSLFDAIVYMADYIEKGRDFFDCVYLREYLYDKINASKDHSERILAFRDAMILSFDLTIKNLIDENKPIDFDTLSARNYFLRCQRPFG